MTTEPGVYARTQKRRKKKIERRRAAHGGVGRTDGPRRRKGEPSYTKGKRIRARGLKRLIEAMAKKTHYTVFGLDQKTGKPVLRLVERRLRAASS